MSVRKTVIGPKPPTVCQAFVVDCGDLWREGKIERETRLAKRRVADIARYAANSDRRTERRAAENSEKRDTRLASRRVADRASLS